MATNRKFTDLAVASCVLLVFVAISYLTITASIFLKTTTWVAALLICFFFRKRELHLWAFFSCLILLSLIALLVYHNSPWIPALALGSVWMIVIAARFSGTQRLIAINTAVVFGLFFVLEWSIPILEQVFLSENKGTRQQNVSVLRLEDASQTPYEYYFENHPAQGYVFRSAILVRESVSIGEFMVYDAEYSIAEDRFRVTPNGPEDLQFQVDIVGDSYSFGQGVRDEQTISYHINQLGSGKVGSRNLGVIGHGPHQVLSYLENNLYPMTESAPDLVVYIAIPDHVNRVSGWAKWDRNGPHYSMVSGGLAKRDGNFGDHSKIIAKGTLLKSDLFSFVFSRIGLRTHGVDLFLAILRSIDQRLKMSGTTFVVVYWDDPRHTNNLSARIAESGIKVVRASDLIPEFYENFARYVFTGDNHPTPLAHQAIAQGLLETQVEFGD